MGNETHCYQSEDTVRLLVVTENQVMVSGLWCYATYKAIDKFLIYGDKGSVEFSYYDNAAPLRVETLVDENAVAHEGVMGGVRKEAELKVDLIFVPGRVTPGMGRFKQTSLMKSCAPGVICSSTLDNALNALKITWAAHLQREEQRKEMRAK